MKSEILIHKVRAGIRENIELIQSFNSPVPEYLNSYYEALTWVLGLKEDYVYCSYLQDIEDETP